MNNFYLLLSTFHSHLLSSIIHRLTLKMVTLPTFHNPQLLKQALTHRSAVNERMGNEHNERLEFLGDAVLELITSEYLFINYPKSTEGELTQARTALVRTETLAELAKKLNLSEKITLSKGEVRFGGQNNPSLLADTMEAVIGAIYMDQGISAAAKFLQDCLLVNASQIIKSATQLDTKSKFQELVQAKGFPSPIYKIVDKDGPDHDRVFTAQVFVGGKPLGKGSGKSKQEAEQVAAKNSFSMI